MDVNGLIYLAPFFIINFNCALSDSEFKFLIGFME